MGFSLAIAGEVTVDLNRIALLTPGQNEQDDYSSRIAIHFTMPDDVEDSDIIYAELLIPLDFSNVEVEGGNILEFQAHNIITEWSEENTDWDGPWENAGGDIDTLTFYTYTLTMSDEAGVYMDVTKFVKSVVEADAGNFGLILIPVKHDLEVFHIYQSIYNQISNSAQLRIKYR